MFTGIIEEIGTIRSVRNGSNSVCLTIQAEKVLAEVKIGDSINTDGMCLTVVSFNAASFSVDVMPETLRRTNLKELKIGSKVNLERAAKLSDRLGGHLVSGHIDGTGVIDRRWEDDNAVWFSVFSEPTILRYVVEKGSIAIDGISLTVAKVDAKSFDVSVIPHTLAVTTLANKTKGSTVNLECDMVAKYVEKLANPMVANGKITPDFLAENGFV